MCGFDLDMYDVAPPPALVNLEDRGQGRLRVAGFSTDLVLACATASALSYDDAICRRRMTRKMPERFKSLEPVELLGDKRCWLLRDPVARVILVAFRGSDSVGDIMRGFKFAPKPLHEHLGAGLVDSDVIVHSGFLEYYAGAQKCLGEAMVDLCTPDYTIAFTGHSLGGAAATLAALEHRLVGMREINHKLYCVSFGSPPTGNRAFVDRFNRGVTRSYRFVCGADMAPRIPIPGMHHVKGGIYLPCPIVKPSDALAHHHMMNYLQPLRNRLLKPALKNLIL